MKQERSFFVYILASQRNWTLYVGITADVLHRTNEHKNKINEGFTQKYNINRLVYFEEYASVYDGIYREKQLKKWNRNWKLELIEKNNPD